MSLMKFGMLTRTGQPSTQNGLGHWMQRSASSIASWYVSPRLTSRKLPARTSPSCSGIETRPMVIRSLLLSGFAGSVPALVLGSGAGVGDADSVMP
jgi:hypothetical protein